MCVHYNHKYHLVEILASLIIYKTRKNYKRKKNEATLWTKGKYIYILHNYHVREIKKDKNKEV